MMFLGSNLDNNATEPSKYNFYRGGRGNGDTLSLGLYEGPDNGQGH